MMNLLETRKIIRTSLQLFLFLVLFSFFARADYSRITLFLALALLLPLLLLGRLFFFKLNQYLYVHGIHVSPALIFGAGTTGRLLFQSIAHTPKLGYKIIGFFDTDPAYKKNIQDLSVNSSNDTIHLLNSIEQCLQVIEQENVQDIFLSKSLYDEQGEQLQQLLALCHNCRIRLHAVPYLQHLFTEQVFLNDINGIPLISFREMPVGRMESFCKRSFDLLLCCPILLFTAPIMAVIALLIKLNSTGPLFFKQPRVGKNSTPFTMYKFRTMYANTPDFQHSPTSNDDPRITRTGKWLRKTSLDELPQIFNVLQGSMSLVGPRPEMEFIVKNQYNNLYRQRLRVKPGITGIWQISADRTREIHEDISYDLFYIANRSLLLDILILIRTIPALLTMHTH
jgi:exopolysaccharide biosynthesis polyprenyl glycosylphosphotransferase